MQEMGRILRRVLSLSGQLACQAVRGPVAQLGERCVRIAEVEGSNPFRSTKSRPSELGVITGLFFCPEGMQDSGVLPTPHDMAGDN